jgi:hypothetical protein
MDSYFAVLVYTCTVPCQDQGKSVLCAEVCYNQFRYNAMCRSQSSTVGVVARLHTRQLKNHDLTLVG